MLPSLPIAILRFHLLLCETTAHFSVCCELVTKQGKLQGAFKLV